MIPMTTPALNVSSWLTGSQGTCYLYPDGHIDYDVPQNGIQWKYYGESRPASTKRVPSSSGWRKPTDWNHSYKRSTKFSGLAFAIHGGQGSGINGVFNQTNPDNLFGLIPLGNMSDIAVNQALLKLSDQKMSISENFAEREQGARLIGDRIRGIANTVLDFKRSKPRLWSKVRGPRRFEAIPEAWLEVQYGWNPLLSDIKGAYDVFREKDKDGDTFVTTVKGSRFEKDTVRGVTDQQTPFGFVVEGSRRSGVFVRLDYNLDLSPLHRFQQVDVTNPFLIAWNLMPYSFVIDWLLPVGDYLQACTADLGYTFLSGSISEWQEKTIRGVGVVSLQPYFTIKLVGGDVSSLYCRQFVTRRIALGSSPAARLPHFKNPLSFTHFANAMSLLVSAFK